MELQIQHKETLALVTRLLAAPNASDQGSNARLVSHVVRLTHATTTVEYLGGKTSEPGLSRSTDRVPSLLIVGAPPSGPDMMASLPAASGALASMADILADGPATEEVKQSLRAADRLRRACQSLVLDATAAEPIMEATLSLLDAVAEFGERVLRAAFLVRLVLCPPTSSKC